MEMQFALSGLEVNIAKRLQLANLQFGEVYEHTSISRETLQVAVALAVQIRTHLLDLKISHIIYPSAQCAFVGTRTPELKTLNQTA